MHSILGKQARNPQIGMSGSINQVPKSLVSSESSAAVEVARSIVSSEPESSSHAAMDHAKAILGQKVSDHRVSVKSVHQVLLKAITTHKPKSLKDVELPTPVRSKQRMTDHVQGLLASIVPIDTSRDSHYEGERPVAARTVAQRIEAQNEDMPVTARVALLKNKIDQGPSPPTKPTRRPTASPTPRTPQRLKELEAEREDKLKRDELKGLRAKVRSSMDKVHAKTKGMRPKLARQRQPIDRITHHYQTVPCSVSVGNYLRSGSTLKGCGVPVLLPPTLLPTLPPTPNPTQSLVANADLQGLFAAIAQSSHSPTQTPTETEETRPFAKSSHLQGLLASFAHSRRAKVSPKPRVPLPTTSWGATPYPTPVPKSVRSQVLDVIAGKMDSSVGMPTRSSMREHATRAPTRNMKFETLREKVVSSMNEIEAIENEESDTGALALKSPGENFGSEFEAGASRQFNLLDDITTSSPTNRPTSFPTSFPTVQEQFLRGALEVLRDRIAKKKMVEPPAHS
jgi:hypothetical protein